VFPQNLDGIVDFERYIPSLKAWFRREWKALNSQPPLPGRGLLMGCPLWGKDFIDRFFYFCLPTILASKNLAALKKNGCRIVIYTDEGDDEGFERFWQMKRDLRRHGIKVEIRGIPHEIIEQVPKLQLNKYWLLGTVQQLLIQEAAESGMAFHALHPDHLHNDTYYLNLFRLAKKNECIAQTSISADLEACLPELEQYRKDGALEIPALEVGDMGWRHMHKQTRYNLMNKVDITKEFPKTHFQCWQGRETLYLYCCHMNATYLSAEVCAKAPVRLHNALDTELPYFMPNGARICVPEASDGMTFIELSDDSKIGGTAQDRVPFTEFAAQCWSTVHFLDHWMPFFAVANEVPIKPQPEGLAFEDIQKLQNSIVQALVNVKPALEDQMRKIAEKIAAERAALQAEAGVKCETDSEAPAPILVGPGVAVHAAV